MERVYVHPRQVRIWHWVNALGVLTLILTGVQIRYADLIGVLSFETAVKVHNWVGFVVIADYFLWLLFYLFSDKIVAYHPAAPTRHFRESFRQMLYYGYGIFRGARNPHHASAYNKFNALQRMMYQMVMLLILPVQFVTGLLLWDVERFADWIGWFGGVRVVDTVHVLVFIFFVSFVFVHVYLGSLGHTPIAHFKAMVTGFEEVEDESDPHARRA